LSVEEWDWVQEFLMVRYEYVLNRGTEFMIKHIEEVTGVQAKCKPSPPRNREKRYLEDSYIKWMTFNVDWKAEALVVSWILFVEFYNGTKLVYLCTIGKLILEILISS
jgi:hypothetical protein